MDCENREHRTMANRLRGFLTNASGATMVEYGLFVALLSVALIGVLFSTGEGIKNTLQLIANALKAM